MSKRKFLFALYAIVATLLIVVLNFRLVAYNAEDLQRLLTTGRSPGGDLSDADLSGRSLKKANLEKANLYSANLSNTNLEDANLNGAVLSNATLAKTILQGAKLVHAILKDANLNEANLRGADLKFVDLSRASLVDADLREVDLSFADLTDADLTGANLYGAILRQTILPPVVPTPGPPSPTPESSESYIVNYMIQSDWGNGATINVTITNNGPMPVNGWNLVWDFPGAQTITNLWNGTYTQNGVTVSVRDVGFNAVIPANGGLVYFGFNLNYSGTNPKPAKFTLTETGITPAPTWATTPTGTPAPGTPTPTRINTPTGTPISGTPTPTRRILPTVPRRITPPVTRRRTSPLPTPTPTPSPRPTPRPTPTMDLGQGLVGGCIVDAMTGLGLNGAQVDAYNGNDYTNYVTSAICDHLGIYTLSLDPGEYQLVVRMSNYLPINIHTEVTKGIIVYEPQSRAVPFVCQGDGIVSGTITDAINGQLVGNVRISFREGVNSRIGTIVRSTNTDSGVYSLNLPAGNYTAEISDSKYITGYQNVVSIGGRTTTQPGYSVTPEVAEDQIRIVLNWETKPGATSVYVTGYDKNDKPLSGYPDIYWNRAYLDNKGPITVTLLRKSQLKNFIYTVHDSANNYNLNSAALLASQAVVRVYQGSDLTATFHVPMTQTGNTWTVFYFDQNGIHPLNQFCDQSDLYKMQAHDFNGKEKLDWVGKGANQLTVFHYDGTQHTYPINAQCWGIFDYQDTDGQPGEEIIIVISRNLSDLYFGRGERYLIIHDRTQTVKEISNFDNTTGSFFLRLEELDGEPGMELALEKYVENPYQYILRIVSDQGNFYRDYDFSNYSPHFYLQMSGELNGAPGKEIVFGQNDFNGHTNLAILNFRDNRMNYYSFESDYSNYWTGDMDGEPGDEIIFVPDYGSPNDGINIIHDRTQTVRKFPDFDNTTHTFINCVDDLDGVPGYELVCETFKDSPYQHMIRIISDRANSYRDYDFSNYGPEFYIGGYIADFNGRPGDELLGYESPLTGGRVAVFSYLDNAINNYTIDYNTYWRIIETVDVDGVSGQELVIEADGSPEGATDKKILIIHDSTKTVRQLPGLGSADTGFQLVAMIDLDGIPGLEFIYARTGSVSYDASYKYTVRILSGRLNSYRDYIFSHPGVYASLYFPLLGDLDGLPGNELVLLGVGDKYEYDILSYRNDRVHRYAIDPAWNELGVYEFDGRPGQEIILMDYTSLRVICDARGNFIQ